MLTNVLKKGTIVPIMSTYNDMIRSGVASALFGRTRLAVLSLLFINSEKEFYLREIIRLLGMGGGSVQRELDKLTRAGLIVRTRRGNQVLYRANERSPVFSEMRALLVKTAGLGDVLREALSPLADRILLAFIFGSFADGTDGAQSDVDLMVVGDVGLRSVVSALREAQEVIGREINPVIFKAGEFAEQARDGRHFIGSVLKAPKIFLIGDEDGLERLVAERVAEGAQDLPRRSAKPP